MWKSVWTGRRLRAEQLVDFERSCSREQHARSHSSQLSALSVTCAQLGGAICWRDPKIHMKRAFLVAAAASSLSCVDAFNVAAPTGPAGRVCRATTAGLPALTPMGPTAALPARLPRANLVMQEQDFYDVRAPPPASA